MTRLFTQVAIWSLEWFEKKIIPVPPGTMGLNGAELLSVHTSIQTGGSGQLWTATGWQVSIILFKHNEKWWAHQQTLVL